MKKNKDIPSGNTRGTSLAGTGLRFVPGLRERLLARCRQNLPAQSFGVLIADEARRCETFCLFEKNLKSRLREIARRFASYGEVYANPRRGFWVDPAEQLELVSRLEKTGRTICAVFHTHRELDATPTPIDLDLHFHKHLPMVIVSLQEPDRPQIRAFQAGSGGWDEVEISDLTQDFALTKADSML